MIEQLGCKEENRKKKIQPTFRTSFCSIKDYEVELDSDRYPQLKSK
jgi:hypothetical protein